MAAIMKLAIVLAFALQLRTTWGGDSSDSDTTEELLDAVHQVHSSWLQTFMTPHTAHLTNYISHSWNEDNAVSEELFDDLLDGSVLDGPEFYQKCGDDLLQILFNMKSEWAIRMLDSSGKLLSGVLDGSVTWPGNFKECLSVYSPLDKKDHGDFHGKYCMLSMSLNASKSLSAVPLSTGMCIPDSCEGKYIGNVIKKFINASEYLPYVKNLASKITFKDVKCVNGPAPADSGTVFYLFIICTFFSLVICGSSITAYEYLTKSKSRTESTISINYAIASNNPPEGVYGTVQSSDSSAKATSISISNDIPIENPKSNLISNAKENKGSRVKEFLLCFCAFTNGSKILKTDASDKQLLSIHGIRFLSLTWVIIGHTYITAANYISNKLQTLKDIDGFMFQMLMNCPFSVDSFFLLSGFLLSYLFLKEADRRSGKINWVYFYLHRLWRLTPVYMLVVGFYMLLFKYMGSGPFWNEDYGDDCRHTWWRYLLYINNFINIHDMCIGWSWYLANDMQFYLMSPLFLYFLWRRPKIGIAIISSLMAISWITTAVLTSKHDIIPMLSGVTEVTDLQEYQDKMWESFNIIYDKPYCRIAPYLVGTLAGYAMHRTGDNKNFLTWWQQSLGWMLAIFCSASVIFGLYHVSVTPAVAIMFNAFSRTSFAVGLAWLIYVCETGHAEILHKFLSWKFWMPLSRLTYCAYLVHPILVHGYYMGMQTPLYFTHGTMVVIFLGITVLSYVLSFVVSFTFESPMMNVEKMLLKLAKRQ